MNKDSQSRVNEPKPTGNEAVFNFEPLTNIGKNLFYIASVATIMGRFALDYHLGADSPFMRATLPLTNYALVEPHDTEEKLQAYLEETRSQIANEGKPELATFITWPWNPDYDSYKTNNSQE